MDKKHRMYSTLEFDAIHKLGSMYAVGNEPPTQTAVASALEDFLIDMYILGFFTANDEIKGNLTVSEKLAAQAVSREVAGKTYNERLTDLFEKKSEGLLMPLNTIFASESHRVFVQGQMDAAQAYSEESSKYLVKMWDSTLDNLTRDTHVTLHGTVKNLDELFETPNGKATAPGQFGVAEEDVNCRCILTFLRY